jgi:carnitine O-acetyltransferase
MPVALSLAPARSLSTTKPLKQVSPTSKPLYASQSSLPKLPIPTLSSTIHKYLETLKPLLTPSQFETSTSAAQEFLHSDFSKTLQKRLEERAGSRDSWLSEWWNEAAYMGYRGRLVPNVSYFYIHGKGLGKGASQEDRAAELIRGVVEFKKLVDRYVLLQPESHACTDECSERLEPEKAKSGPLDMSSYKYL